MLRPPCTFLIPVFNGHQFLHNATRNIIEMAGSDDEILYINDGSTDQSVQDWNQILVIDRRIKILHQPHRGIVAALNNGIAHSTTDFIARVDIDDSYSPDRINNQFEYFLKYDNCGAVFCDYEFVNSENKQSLGPIFSAVTPSLTLLSLANPQRMPHPGALIAKRALIDVGGYLEQDFPCEDYGLWLRLAKKYAIVSAPETLLNYSVSKKSVTALHSAEMRLRVNSLRQKHLPRILSPVADQAVLREYFSYSHLANSTERKILTARDLLTLLIRRIKIFNVSTYFLISIDLFSHGRSLLRIFFGILKKRRMRDEARRPATTK